jgi:isoleucyl-tRNA synthetase
MGDWMISKKRFWGLALPIWCFEDGSFHVVGSKQELKELSVEGWDEFEGNSPHRPWIDKVKIKHPKTGLIGTRILDVGNPWLDAGIVAFSTLDYRTNRENWEKWYPADLISESFPGQFRNWFYSYLTMGTALENKTPAKNIFSYAMVRDESGEEMHKSAGNAIWFDDAAEDIGVDVIRWLYTRQNPELNLRFGPKIADEVRRQTIIPLWNIYSFFTNYAILDYFAPPQQLIEPKSDNLMDKWIIIETKSLCIEIAKRLENYQPDKAAIAVEEFINLLSNWYVRRNRKRFWKPGKFGTDAPFDNDKYCAYQSLYFVLVTLAKALAPIVPFMTEQIYQNLTNNTQWGKPSVHLEEYPKFKHNTEKDAELQNAIRTAMKISSLGRGARSQASIKVRQPLHEIKVIVPEKIKAYLIDEIEFEVKEELNIKEVMFLQKQDELSPYIEFKIEPDLAILGPKYGKNINKIKSEIQISDPYLLYSSIQGKDEVKIGKYSIPSAALKISTIDKKGYSSKSDLGYTVVLSTDISNELYVEGIAREFVHNIQNLRREAKLEVSDKINVMYSGSGLIDKVMIEHNAYIKSETLCEKIDKLDELPSIACAEIVIGQERISIVLEKAK